MKHFILSLWYKYKSWQYERKCIKYFGAKPEKIYLSAEDFDALQKRLSEPPKYNARLAEILRGTPPWERTDD